MVDLTMVMFLWGGDWLFLVRVEDIVEFTHIVPTTESSFKYFDIAIKNWMSHLHRAWSRKGTGNGSLGEMF